jgi:hypothetical protein
VNIPVALIALALIFISKPVTEHRPARMDYRGVVLIAAGVALSVFGFQQAGIWGWGNPGTGLCIAAGAALLVVFYFVELRTSSPLIQVSIFRIRPFLVENLVLGVAMMAFVPVFFFASEYAQISLGKTASQAGTFLLYFFIGFVIAAQIGGRMLDRRGAKLPVALGCALAAVGYWLWAGKVTGLSFSSQQWFSIMSGAGMGFMLGPASTDAVNRASRLSYGEATGITQTVRNYTASLGLAILGTILVTEMRSRLTTSLTAQGLPRARAQVEAALLAQSRGARAGAWGRPAGAARGRPAGAARGQPAGAARGAVGGGGAGAAGGGGAGAIPHFYRLDFAYATRTVFYVMAGIMAVAWLVAVLGLRRGAQADTVADGTVRGRSGEMGERADPADPAPAGGSSV